jgi:hypothetical protein
MITMKFKSFLTAASVFLLATCLHAQNSISGSGGTLLAPTSVGSTITASPINLVDGRTASVSCPVTFFGAGTYQWNWHCGDDPANPGFITLSDGSVLTIEAASMTLTCAGGGRAHPVTCAHNLSGSLVGGGTFNVQSKGGSNNAPSTVVSFSANW